MNTIFHWYGLFLGLGVVVALELIERKARQLHLDETWLRKVLAVGLLAGFVGARLWHVVTDFSLYQANLVAVFFVWQGGLSIIGGIGGGVLGVVWAARRWTPPKHTPRLVLDVLVFGVPFGQAFGRLGNWFNQELYGTPTALPWGIYIDPAHRVATYAEQAFFHPLFAYEALALFLFGCVLWLQIARKPSWREHIGTGNFAVLYVFLYGVLRFFLEFLRVQKSMSVIPGLSSNQVAIVIVLSALIVALLSARWFDRLQKRVVMGLLVVVSVGLMIAGGVLQRSEVGQSNSDTLSVLATPTLAQLRNAQYDHRLLQIKLGTNQLVTEVVNTPSSITQGLSGRATIGADGMLFVFPQSQRTVFWMPEMQFDLDIIWIADGTVIGVTQNVPKPMPKDSVQTLPKFPSPGMVELVLEVPAGSAAAWGVSVGTAVFLEQFK